jgi:hypothetical protein
MQRKQHTTTPRLQPKEHATAFNVAQAFHAVALPTLTGLARGMQEGPEYAAKHPAEIAVAVTNLGFALELYLKAVRAWVGLESPETHDLWVLYKSLPVDVKQRIERLYEQDVATRDPNTMFTMHAIVEQSPDGPSVVPKFPPTQPLLKDAPNLLRRAKSLAVSWRYPNDAVPVGARYSPVNTFEHSHLALLANALVAFIRANTTVAYASTAA